VTDEKTMTHDEALELLECFWIKCNGAMLRSYEFVKVLTGMGLGLVLTMGGQTRDGKDACNDVTMLCLETDEQLGVLLPETAFRIWEGTPDKYLRKATELVRLGYGKPKFIMDKTGIKMLAKGYPELTIKDGGNIPCWDVPRPTCRTLPWGIYTKPTASSLRFWN